MVHCFDAVAFFVWQELNELDGFGFANHLDNHSKEEYPVLVTDRPSV